MSGDGKDTGCQYLILKFSSVSCRRSSLGEPHRGRDVKFVGRPSPDALESPSIVRHGGHSDHESLMTIERGREKVIEFLTLHGKNIWTLTTKNIRVYWQFNRHM